MSREAYTTTTTFTTTVAANTTTAAIATTTTTTTDTTATTTATYTTAATNYVQRQHGLLQLSFHCNGCFLRLLLPLLLIYHHEICDGDHAHRAHRPSVPKPDIRKFREVLLQPSCRFQC